MSIMQQKTAALIGTYLISYKSELGTLRYVLHIDSARGAFFFGRMENDTRYHPDRRDFCHVKGILAERKHYSYIMKPDFTRGAVYTLPCSPSNWLLNNKTYFSFEEEDIIRGYMVIANEMDVPKFSFSGRRQPLARPPKYGAGAIAFGIMDRPVNDPNAVCYVFRE
ncbi:hypothetical protein ACWKWU_03850 [Chitinophaga lutea]